MKKKIVIIGAGFAGLSAASFLAKDGYEVSIIEKNESAGGRARKFSAEGFTFDMGPSWYWMPDIFDKYFAAFGHERKDFYELVRLDPSYRVYLENALSADLAAAPEELEALFESYEEGAGLKLRKFLEEAAYKYRVGIDEFVYKPSTSITEFLDIRIAKDAFRLQLFQSMHDHIRKYFSHPVLIKLLEFPVLFLGAIPKNTPALYSLMNYADMILGTWYPMGGMHKIIEAMVSIAEKQGVKIHLNEAATEIKVENKNTTGVLTDKGFHQADAVIGGADYHHVEQHLLPKEYRRYNEEYWNKRSMAPSCLLYYVGINKKVKELLHHNLFFDTDFVQHSHEIYTDPQWPSDPLFYVSVTSKTDPSVAPSGCENMFLLIPVAPGIVDSEEIRDKYFEQILGRLEERIGQKLRDSIVYKRSFAYKDFKSEYNSFKGNAYGLANTLKQTAILKPSIKSKKIKNLFYTGQLTVPGPGVPPSIISGEVVAREVSKLLAK